MTLLSEQLGRTGHPQQLSEPAEWACIIDDVAMMSCVMYMGNEVRLDLGVTVGSPEVAWGIVFVTSISSRDPCTIVLRLVLVNPTGSPSPIHLPSALSLSKTVY